MSLLISTGKPVDMLTVTSSLSIHHYLIQSPPSLPPTPPFSSQCLTMKIIISVSLLVIVPETAPLSLLPCMLVRKWYLMLFVISVTYYIAQCSMPTIGPNVTVEGYTNGVEGSQITCYCQPGLQSSTRDEKMVAICTSNSQWSPDPTSLECSVTNITLTTQVYNTLVSGWY